MRKVRLEAGRPRRGCAGRSPPATPGSGVLQLPSQGTSDDDGGSRKEKEEEGASLSVQPPRFAEGETEAQSRVVGEQAQARRLLSTRIAQTASSRSKQVLPLIASQIFGEGGGWES